MKVRDVCAAVEKWAPVGWQYEWDRSGLALGHPDDDVSKVLVCLTVTRDAFKAAVRAKANLIISHHPLIWDAFRSLRSDDPVARLCLDIAESRIACYSAHTNLDLAPGGVNDVLAEQLGLHETAPLIVPPQAALVKLAAFVPESHLAPVRDAVSKAGAGVIGEYTHCSFSAPGTGTFLPSEKAQPFSGKRHVVNEEPEQRFEILVPKAKLPVVLTALFGAHPYEEVAYDVYPLENKDTSISLGLRGILEKSQGLREFALAVRKALDISHVRMVGKPKQKVKRVAVLGGSGGGMIDEIPDDVDVYVTGDVKYHDALSAQERGIAVIDAGHHGTEKFIVPAMADYLKANLEDVGVSTYSEPETFQAVAP